MLLAIQTEVVLAVLAPTSIFLALDDRRAAASRDRTPAHVIHGRDGVLHTEALVLLHHARVQAHVLDVQVVEALVAFRFGATQLAYLAGVDLGDDHVSEALSAIVVHAARQEGELVSEESAHANATVLLLHIELPPEGKPGRLASCLELLRVFKLNRDITLVILDQLFWILFNQSWDQLILDDVHHFINGRLVLHPDLGQVRKDCRFEPLIEGTFKGYKWCSIAWIGLDESDGQLDRWESSELQSQTLNLVLCVKLAIEVGNDAQIHDMKDIFDTIC